MHEYYKALTIKWFVLGTFSSITAAFFLFTFLLEGITKNWPLEATLASVFFGTLFGLSLLYEWYYANPHTFWGRTFSQIFNTSYVRTMYLKPKDAMRAVLTFLALILVAIVFSCVAWQFPSLALFCNAVIGIAGATMGTYMYKEEFNAPEGFKQRGIFWGSLFFLLLSILMIWFLSNNDVQFDDKHRNSSLLLVSVGAWLALGIVGSIVTNFCRRAWNKFLNLIT